MRARTSTTYARTLPVRAASSFGFVVADRFAVGTFFAADLQRCELADGALGLLRDAPALSSLSSSPLATVPLMCSAKSVTWVRI